MVDIVFKQNSIFVEGPMGVDAEPTSNLTARNEIHSVGNVAGFSYADRSAPETRWVIYSDKGITRFWNGADRFQIDAGGNITAQNIHCDRMNPFIIVGRISPIRRRVCFFTEDLQVVNMTTLPDGKLEPKFPSKNVWTKKKALSHEAGDTLVLNKDKFYDGGVSVEGKLRVDGTDLLAEIVALKSEIAALKAKVK